MQKESFPFCKIQLYNSFEYILLDTQELTENYLEISNFVAIVLIIESIIVVLPGIDSEVIWTVYSWQVNTLCCTSFQCYTRELKISFGFSALHFKKYLNGSINAGFSATNLSSLCSLAFSRIVT